METDQATIYKKEKPMMQLNQHINKLKRYFDKFKCFWVFLF